MKYINIFLHHCQPGQVLNVLSVSRIDSGTGLLSNVVSGSGPDAALLVIGSTDDLLWPNNSEWLKHLQIKLNLQVIRHSSSRQRWSHLDDLTFSRRCLR